MANGATREALSNIQLKKTSGNTENTEMKELYAKGAKTPKYPLKAGASEHNHSK